MYAVKEAPTEEKFKPSFKPNTGHIIIQIPERVSRTKSGLYIDTSFPTGTEYDYQHECDKVAAQVIRSEEGRYMKKWGQTEKLVKIIKREIARVPRNANEATLGADRYNQLYADVLASGDDSITPGDRVYFSYLTIPNLRDAGQIFSNDDFTVQWSVIQTSKCYFKITNGEIVMLNDFYLLTPIRVEISRLAISNENNKFDNQRGVIAHAPCGSELKKGDVIIFDKGCDALLEYELNQSLPDQYFCVRESDILALVQ